MVESLERAGAQVWAVACDTSNLEALQGLMAKIANQLPPLKGVFHSGAIIKDQPIAEIDLATLAT